MRVMIGTLFLLHPSDGKTLPADPPGLLLDSPSCHRRGFSTQQSVDGSDEAKLVAFRKIRDEIDARIKAWLKEPRTRPVVR